RPSRRRSRRWRGRAPAPALRRGARPPARRAAPGWGNLRQRGRRDRSGKVRWRRQPERAWERVDSKQEPDPAQAAETSPRRARVWPDLHDTTVAIATSGLARPRGPRPRLRSGAPAPEAALRRARARGCAPARPHPRLRSGAPAPEADAPAPRAPGRRCRAARSPAGSVGRRVGRAGAGLLRLLGAAVLRGAVAAGRLVLAALDVEARQVEVLELLEVLLGQAGR